MIPVPILLQHQPKPNHPELELVQAAAIAWRWGSEYSLPPVPNPTLLLKASGKVPKAWLPTAVLEEAKVLGAATDTMPVTQEFLAWAARERPAIIYGLILMYPSYVAPQLNLNPAEQKLLTDASNLAHDRIKALHSPVKTDYTKLYESIRPRK